MMKRQSMHRHAALARLAALPLVMLVLLTAGSIGASAQQPAPVVTVNQLDASGYPDLRAVVTVLDAGGIPVADLPQAAFAVDGEPGVTVASVSPAQDGTLGLAVVLVIDTSGSMAGPPIEAARAAATAFVEQLGPNDQVLLMAFSGDVRQVVPFTSDRTALAAGIAGLQAEGETALYEATRASLFAARSSAAPRQAVVILSDGENDTQGSLTTEADALDAARGARVPVFAIAYGDQSDTGYLQRAAAETRGAFYAASAVDVSAVYSGIAAMLRSQYVLTLRAAAPADGLAAALRVTATIGGQSTASEPVQFTRGVAPPPPTAEPTKVEEPAPAEAESRESSSLVLWLLGGALVAGALGVAVIFAVSRLAERRAQARRERFAGQQSDQPIPGPAPGRAEAAAPEIHARLVALDNASAPLTVPLSGVPVVIGSDPAADVRLQDDDVAARHATVWIRDGKITLRHTGGLRPTLVEGKPVDVVILDAGDEFAIGRHRYRAEILDAAEEA